jgi:choline dehydrogenase-like flavoprotein
MTKTYSLNDDSVVVVIGSGAGGGTVSNELAQRGVDVVCLEAGGRLTENDAAVMDQKMGWHDKRLGAPVWVCKTVGGTTMRWSGMTPRFRDYEFRPRSTYGALEGTSLIDWPLTLDEILPYYDKAEAKMGISGTHGTPPSFETSNYKVMKAGAKRIGYREVTSERTAINSVARDGRPACQQIGFCWAGCAVGAKWSTLYTEVPKAEATGHFELRTGAMAIKVTHDTNGKVRSVIYADADGVTHEQKARAVCVAGNVVETTRLLHNSQSNLFPDGLGNSSGHLGRNYMRHVMSLTLAVMPGPVKTSSITTNLAGSPVVTSSRPRRTSPTILPRSSVAGAGSRPTFWTITAILQVAGLQVRILPRQTITSLSMIPSVTRMACLCLYCITVTMPIPRR